MRLLLLLAIGCSPTLPGEQPTPPKVDPPPTETWERDGVRITVASTRTVDEMLYMGLRIEPTGNGIVDLSSIPFGDAAAVDSRGNHLPRLRPPIGQTFGVVRPGKIAGVVLHFPAATDGATHVDVSFGDVRLRVLKKSAP